MYREWLKLQKFRQTCNFPGIQLLFKMRRNMILAFIPAAVCSWPKVAQNTSIWISWYGKFTKKLHAIFHCCSKITSVWNWTVACVLGNLYEINFYSCLYKQNLLLSTTWLGFRKFPKWFIVICAYSMKLIYYWTYAVILARENRSSEPFIQKYRRIHIVERKKKLSILF